MSDILPMLGEKVTEGVVLLMVLWWLSKEITEVKSTISSKIDNGITSRLNSIEQDVAWLKGKAEVRRTEHNK